MKIATIRTFLILIIAIITLGSFADFLGYQLVSSGGNIGIGISSPTSKLHVVNTNSAQPTFIGVGSNTVSISYDGLADIIFPHAVYSNTSTITYTSTTEGKAIAFPVMGDTLGIYKSGNGDTTISVRYAGVYEILLSVECDVTSGTGNIDVYLQKNGATVANSNTEITVTSAVEALIVVSYFETFAAGDYFRIKTHATDTDCRLPYYAASGVVPATPSVIMTVKKASK